MSNIHDGDFFELPKTSITLIDSIQVDRTQATPPARSNLLNNTKTFASKPFEPSKN